MRRIRNLLVAIVTGHLSAGALLAQEIRRGGPPIGVQVNVIHDEYTVVGASAQEILDQLQANGWTRYRVVYRYRYTFERVRLTNGMASTRCRPFDFEYLFDFTARYPQWDRPPDASAELVAAWDAFALEVESQWEQYRDDIVGRAREAVRRLRRFEDECAFLNDRIRERVYETFEERDPITAHEPQIRIQWPPEEHEGVLRQERAENRAGVVSEPAPASPDVPVTRELPALEPLVYPAVSIDVAVSMDLADGATGLVVDLHHLGTPQFTEAFGTTEPDGTEPLTPEMPFDFPGLTDLLVATAVKSLAATDRVDLDARLSTFLPDVSPGLGRTTLRQLLDHRAGLDNAMVPDTAEWNSVMERLDDRALFTEPDAIFSYSRYSYPLVMRALDAAMGRPFETVVGEELFGPLGMVDSGFGSRDALNTRDGLPLARTTVADMERFWAAWLDGAIPGSGSESLLDVQEDPDAPDGRTFTGGLWYDRIGGVRRLSLMCGAPAVGHAAGTQLFPDTRTIVTFWGRYDLADPEGQHPPPSATRWPKESFRFVLSRIAGSLGLTNEVYRPTMLTGGGQPGRAARMCAEPSVSESRVEDFGPRVPAGDWAGRYVNGEWFFQLVENDDGTLGSPVDPSRAPYSVRHYGGSVYFTNMDLPNGPDVGFPLRLVRDYADRRYVVLGDRAYLHEDDRPAR